MHPILSQKEIEKEFPIFRKYRYINSASTGILPQRSIKEMQKFLRRYRGDGISHDAESFGMIDNLRCALGTLLGAPADRIALTMNTSHGINIAACGLPISQDDVIVLPPDEFPANFYPWKAQEKRGARIVIASEPKEELLDICGAKVIALSWVRFFDGLRFDMEKCHEIAKKHNAYLCVDGIQGAGVLVANLSKSGIDVFSAGGQKWLLSPYGTGVLYVRENVPIEPIYANWLSRFSPETGWASLRKYNLPPIAPMKEFEMGSFSYHNLWAMYRSIEFLNELGIQNIEKYTTWLARTFAKELTSLGVEVETRQEGLISSIVSMRCGNFEKLREVFRKRKIICSYREGLFRFSFHIYNVPEDIEQGIQGIKEVFKK